MLNRFLFESPWFQGMVLVAAEVVLLLVWRARRTAGARRAAWVGLALIPMLLGLNHLVVTSREEVIAACRTMARAVERGDVETIAGYVHPDFAALDLDRTVFLEQVEQTLSRYEVKEARLYQFEVSVPDPASAAADFHVACFVSGPYAARQRLISRWKVTFTRRGSRWRMIGLEALPTPLSPIKHLRDVFR